MIRPAKRRLARALAAAALLLPWCCGSAAPAPLAQGTVRVSGNHGVDTITVELARSAAERELGLMDRAALGAEQGMLFLYAAPRGGDAGFWMYRTHIPLDIAFIDPRGRIVALRTMTPCRSSDPGRCPVYYPNVVYQWALEVNAGYFSRHGVNLGDRVELLPPPN